MSQILTPPYQLPDLRPQRVIAQTMRLSGGAVVTENGVLASDDFVPGVSGWCIYGNGDVEFNSGVFRDFVEATGLAINVNNTLATYTFDATTDGWVAEASASVARVTVDPFSGAGNLKISNTGTAGTYRGARSPSITGVQEGRYYQVQMATRLEGTLNQDGHLAIEWYDSAAALISSSSSMSSIEHNNWNQLYPNGYGDPYQGPSMVALAPANAVSAKIYVTTADPVFTCYIEIDSVTFAEVGVLAGNIYSYGMDLEWLGYRMSMAGLRMDALDYDPAPLAAPMATGLFFENYISQIIGIYARAETAGYDQLVLTGERILVDGLLSIPSGLLYGGYSPGTDFDFLRKSQVVKANLGGNSDSNNAAMTAWGPVASLTSPAWATKVQVTASVAGCYAITNTSNQRLRIGTAGISVDLTAYDFGTSPRFFYTWTDQFTVSGNTSIPFQIYAQRSGGAGTLRADATTDFTYKIDWLP